MLESLIVLAGLVLLVLVLLWQKQDPWPQRRKELPVMLMYCAWCIDRVGEDCTNQASPVYGLSCGPVCVCAQWCEVREVERWRSIV